MTGIDSVELSQVIIHKVGNPTKSEALGLSVHALTLNDEAVSRILLRYFLSPFNEQELFQFTHVNELSQNEVYTYAKGIFDQPRDFVPLSQNLAKLLYSCSTHSRVKEGELYVVLLENVPFEGGVHRAIGLFKSETKETFLKVFPHGKSWELSSEEGVNINRLDKGCLIIETARAEGFRVCVVDNTNKQQDAQYWVKTFLQIEPVANSYHQTDNCLQMCRLFVANEYADNFDVSKSDQLDLMGRSMDYFKTHDQFNLQDFTEEVIHHPELVDSSLAYKKNFESGKELPVDDEFAIHLSAVKKQAKVFKSVIKLDKNFHVYIHGRRDLIEKGVDEFSGKKFYKLYFEEEA